MFWEDSLENETATHSSLLAWKIPCTEEPVQSVTESDTTEQLRTHAKKKRKKVLKVKKKEKNSRINSKKAKGKEAEINDKESKYTLKKMNKAKVWCFGNAIDKIK